MADRPKPRLSLPPPARHRAEDPDETVVISVPVSLMPEAAPGSIDLPCSFCGEPTWVSATALAVVMQGATVVCIPCTPEDWFAGQIKTPPGSMEEIEMTEGPEARKMMERAIRRHNLRHHER